MKTFRSIYPYDQTLVAEYPVLTNKQVMLALEQSEQAFFHWSGTSFTHRAEILLKVAGLLKQNKQSLAQLITREMGKVLKESIAEIEKCAWGCEYYAQHAEQFLKDEIVHTGYQKSFVAYQPLGAVLAVMPWNFPFWQVFRFAAPALMAGNVALLKHAHNVTGCSLAIEKLFKEAGAPGGVFQSLIITSEMVEAVLKADIVQAVSLTGSEAAGSAVASIAASQIKKSVLELGGADAFIVLKDADLEKAAEEAVNSRMQNAGQSCIAAKRFLIESPVHDLFLEAVQNQVSRLKLGDPFDASVTTGPMATIELANGLKKQMQESLDKGAQLIFGGKVEQARYEPSILNNVQQGMPAFDEETFGPLMNITRVKDEQEAIRLANAHRYGLGNNVWTNDIEKGITVARQLQSGGVFINAMTKSEPALPFGGVKKSGYGRELSYHGIREFVNIKTIAVA